MCVCLCVCLCVCVSVSVCVGGLVGDVGCSFRADKEESEGRINWPFLSVIRGRTRTQRSVSEMEGEEED